MRRKRDRITARVAFGSASRYLMPLNLGSSIIAREQKIHGKRGGWTGRKQGYGMLPQNGPPDAPWP